MTWTAKLVNKAKSKGMISATVEFTDGVDTITQVYTADTITNDYLAKRVADKIASLDAVDANYAALADIGSKITPATVDGGREAYFAKLNQYNIEQNLIENGSIAAGSVTKADLKALWSDDFKDDPRLG